MNATHRPRMAWPAWLQPAPDSAVARMREAGQSPRLQALYLLWSFWLFITPLYAVVDAAFWWSLALGYPVFLLLFALSYVRPTHEARAWTTAMAVLAGLSIPWNPGAWTYAVFACAMVPYEASIVRSISWLVMIQVLLVLEAWLLHWPWYLPVMMVCVCTSVGIGSLAERVNARKNHELRESHEQIRRLAATAERERIGRDLHDLLGHTLSLITLKLELSRKLFDRDHAAAKRELEEAERVARHALAEVRGAVSGMRVANLAAELAAAQVLLESSGVHLHSVPLPTSLPAGIERGLALVLREAATNIARHAQASEARMTLALAGDVVRLCIDDDGRGGVDADGNGLAGMRERVRALGGTLQIESPRKRGTHLCVELPLPAKDRACQAAPAEAEPVAVAVGLQREGHVA